jgi:SMC interacting uncharacterized protein involved in chromosome segregation
MSCGAEIIFHHQGVMVMALPAKRFDAESSMEERVGRLEERVAHIQSDMSDVKGDIRRIDTKVDALRENLTTHRLETKESFAAVRIEMKESFAALEKRMLAGLAAQDAKMQSAFAERDVSTQKSFAALENQLQKLSSWVRIGQLIERFWWIGVAAAILGVVARALDWI